jgi:hypothetical protein
MTNFLDPCHSQGLLFGRLGKGQIKAMNPVGGLVFSHLLPAINPMSELTIASIPRHLVWSEIGVKRARGEDYVKLLKTYCPDEFKFVPNQRGFTPAQMKMLRSVRLMFAMPPQGQGLIKAQVIEILKTQGI